VEYNNKASCYCRSRLEIFEDTNFEVEEQTIVSAQLGLYCGKLNEFLLELYLHNTHIGYKDVADNNLTLFGQ